MTCLTYAFVRIIHQTHPQVDKNMWASDFIIGTKDATKPFPYNQSLPVLKWRLSSKDESLVPLLINFWLSPSGSGTVDCTVEFELIMEKLELRNVVISIPLMFDSFTTHLIACVQSVCWASQSR